MPLISDFQLFLLILYLQSHAIFDQRYSTFTLHFHSYNLAKSVVVTLDKLSDWIWIMQQLYIFPSTLPVYCYHKHPLSWQQLEVLVKHLWEAEMLWRQNLQQFYYHWTEAQRKDRKMREGSWFITDWNLQFSHTILCLPCWLATLILIPTALWKTAIILNSTASRANLHLRNICTSHILETKVGKHIH